MAEQITERVTISMSPADLAVLDDWSFARRIRSRSEAIRQLVALGLAADAAGWTPEPAAPPKKGRRGK